MKAKTHEPKCPRFQFWDAGEYEAPCLCGLYRFERDNLTPRGRALRDLRLIIDGMNERGNVIDAAALEAVVRFIESEAR